MDALINLAVARLYSFWNYINKDYEYKESTEMCWHDL